MRRTFAPPGRDLVFQGKPCALFHLSCEQGVVQFEAAQQFGVELRLYGTERQEFPVGVSYTS
jgi:hypothetical protein